MPNTRVPRIENIAQQRLKAFKKYNDEAISQDPIVKEHREKLEREKKEREKSTVSEITQQVIADMSRDKVTKKGKKATDSLSTTTSKLVDDILKESSPDMSASVSQPKRPKVYNLRNKKTVANNIGMKISLFDKSFERDQL
jgi:hypothetical protein